MKRSLCLIILAILTSTGFLYGQTFDWNIRGGLNLMNGQPSDKKVFPGYHAGVQAGVRVSYYGFYGEAVYSVHQNQDGGDPIAYFMPGIDIKRYLKQFLFVDVGGAFLIMTGEPSIADPTLNPENMPVFMAGLGAKISKVELSMRAISGSSGYVVVQVTAAVKF
jgi:hypothetical protein